MKSITVFCGASLGKDERFKEQAFTLGQRLAQQKIRLIYGGAKIGIMGAIADGALSLGGEVIGVIPAFLKSKEVAHDKLSDLITVQSMHERKAKMNELSDGVIALPGGFGTLEELFEMLTWAQLGLHSKPIGLLNTAGYYDALISMIQKMSEMELLSAQNQNMLLLSSNMDELLEKMQNYTAPFVPKWISEDTV